MRPGNPTWQPSPPVSRPQGAVALAVVVTTQVWVVSESSRMRKQRCQPEPQALVMYSGALPPAAVLPPDYQQPAAAGGRAAAVRGAMLHAWKSYERYALGSDELHPVSKSAKKSVQGGMGVPGASVTTVDALSTLHLLGLADEFDRRAPAPASGSP